MLWKFYEFDGISSEVLKAPNQFVGEGDWGEGGGECLAPCSSEPCFESIVTCFTQACVWCAYWRTTMVSLICSVLGFPNNSSLTRLLSSWRTWWTMSPRWRRILAELQAGHGEVGGQLCQIMWPSYPLVHHTLETYNYNSVVDEPLKGQVTTTELPRFLSGNLSCKLSYFPPHTTSVTTYINGCGSIVGRKCKWWLSR